MMRLLGIIGVLLLAAWPVFATAPIVDDIPDVRLRIATPLPAAYDLDSYVSDYDTPKTSLTWTSTHGGPQNATVTKQTDNAVDISAMSSQGADTITWQASDGTQNDADASMVKASSFRINYTRAIPYRWVVNQTSPVTVNLSSAVDDGSAAGTLTWASYTSQAGALTVQQNGSSFDLTATASMSDPVKVGFKATSSNSADGWDGTSILAVKGLVSQKSGATFAKHSNLEGLTGGTEATKLSDAGYNLKKLDNTAADGLYSLISSGYPVNTAYASGTVLQLTLNNQVGVFFNSAPGVPYSAGKIYTMTMNLTSDSPSGAGTTSPLVYGLLVGIPNWQQIGNTIYMNNAGTSSAVPINNVWGTIKATLRTASYVTDTGIINRSVVLANANSTHVWVDNMYYYVDKYDIDTALAATEIAMTLSSGTADGTFEAGSTLDACGWEATPDGTWHAAQVSIDTTGVYNHTFKENTTNALKIQCVGAEAKCTNQQVYGTKVRTKQLTVTTPGYYSIEAWLKSNSTSRAGLPACYMALINRTYFNIADVQMISPIGMPVASDGWQRIVCQRDFVYLPNGIMPLIIVIGDISACAGGSSAPGYYGNEAIYLDDITMNKIADPAYYFDSAAYIQG